MLILLRLITPTIKQGFEIDAEQTIVADLEMSCLDFLSIQIFVSGISTPTTNIVGI